MSSSTVTLCATPLSNRAKFCDESENTVSPACVVTQVGTRTRLAAVLKATVASCDAGAVGAGQVLCQHAGRKRYQEQGREVQIQ